jgi:pyrimidine deaminase RibD-like protein
MDLDKVFMLRALKISQAALPECKPNPPVGCVLVLGGQVIAEGFTQKIGGNHAEVEAISAYDGPMEEVTAYVTLEPRTSACSSVIIKSGIKRVVVAILDPDARNNGKGLYALEKEGIKVDIGIASREVSEFLHPYLGKS